MPTRRGFIGAALAVLAAPTSLWGCWRCRQEKSPWYVVSFVQDGELHEVTLTGLDQYGREHSETVILHGTEPVVIEFPYESVQCEP